MILSSKFVHVQDKTAEVNQKCVCVCVCVQFETGGQGERYLGASYAAGDRVLMRLRRLAARLGVTNGFVLYGNNYYLLEIIVLFVFRNRAKLPHRSRNVRNSILCFRVVGRESKRSSRRH